MSELSLNEKEHARQAWGLRQVFGQQNAVMTGSPPTEKQIEALAEFLHQQYRAAAKAMERAHGLGWKGHDGKFIPSLDKYHRPILHDHGWGDCYGKKKQYFLRRSRWLLTDYPAPNGGFREKSR